MPPYTLQDLKGINNVKLGALTEDLLLKSIRRHDARESGRGGHGASHRAQHTWPWHMAQHSVLGTAHDIAHE